MRNRTIKAEKALAQVERGERLSRLHPLAVAFHEAAHCVFLEAFDIRVGWATCVQGVDPEDGSFCLGMTSSNAPNVALPPGLHIIHMLAGSIAEHALISKHPFDPKNFNVSATDSRGIKNMLRKTWKTNQEAVGHVVRCAEKTHELTQEPEIARWIKAVAVELYIAKRLEGDEVRKILRANGFYDGKNPLVEFAARITELTAQLARENPMSAPSTNTSPNEFGI